LQVSSAQLILSNCEIDFFIFRQSFYEYEIAQFRLNLVPFLSPTQIKSFTLSKYCRCLDNINSNDLNLFFNLLKPIWHPAFLRQLLKKRKKTNKIFTLSKYCSYPIKFISYGLNQGSLFLNLLMPLGLLAFLRKLPNQSKKSVISNLACQSFSKKLSLLRTFSKTL